MCKTWIGTASLVYGWSWFVKEMFKTKKQNYALAVQLTGESFSDVYRCLSLFMFCTGWCIYELTYVAIYSSKLFIINYISSEIFFAWVTSSAARWAIDIFCPSMRHFGQSDRLITVLNDVLIPTHCALGYRAFLFYMWILEP